MIEITEQEKLGVTCPSCDSERIFLFPDEEVTETVEHKNNIYICVGCHKVFEVGRFTYTLDGVEMLSYVFKHIGDTEVDRDG